MEYAIETLKIEASKCKETIRVVEHYSAYPEYPNGCMYNEYVNKLRELEKAISILEKGVGSFA